MITGLKTCRVSGYAEIRRMFRYLFGLTVLALNLFSCSTKTREGCEGVPELKSKISVEIIHLEKEIADIRTKQQCVDLFRGREILRDVFFSRSAYPDDSAFINTLYRRFTNAAFDTLSEETEKVFGDGAALQKSFDDAFSYLRHYYPEARVPKVITVISGMENDLFVSDSLVIVGLDFFLGPQARYRPNMYEYMLQRYQKDYIIPAVMLLYGISDRYNRVNTEDKTALADMIAYGKAYTFTRFMVPCIPDSTLFGYTAKEADGARANEDIIWEKLVGNQVLYETSHLIKQRYIGERPNTGEISANCPGRIGMWVGMRMTDKYLQETGRTLQELMNEPDAGKIFKESRYRPKRKPS